MGKQHTPASLAYTTKGKVTRRERFLSEMDAVIPWADLLALIAPHYPQAGRGRQTLPMAVMLRVYFLQQWFNLSDPQAEDMLYDSESMRRVELGDDTVPDETTILRFRHLLETHQLTAAMFATVRTHLESGRMLLKAGTIVDATIIAAPSSTKNAAQTRDPEMRQTKKGKMWHFRDEDPCGERSTRDRAHGEDDGRGADRHHAILRPAPRRGDGGVRRQSLLVCGSSSRLRSAGRRLQDQSAWAADAVLGQGQPRARARMRAHVEHPFHVVKRLWGFTKVRYRGLAKNTVRVIAALMPSNLYLLRHRLAATT